MVGICIFLGLGLLVLLGACTRALDIVESQTLGIGQWTAAAMHTLGDVVRTIDANGLRKTYMYGQFVIGSGAAGHDGVPVGLAATVQRTGGPVFQADQSAVLGKAVVGVIRSDYGATAVTTTYYGWIQKLEQGEILDSVICKTAVAGGDRLYWATDIYLESLAAFDSTKDVASVVGVALTPAAGGAAAGTTANQYTSVIALPGLAAD